MTLFLNRVTFWRSYRPCHSQALSLCNRNLQKAKAEAQTTLTGAYELRHGEMVLCLVQVGQNDRRACYQLGRFSAFFLILVLGQTQSILRSWYVLGNSKMVVLLTITTWGRLFSGQLRVVSTSGCGVWLPWGNCLSSHLKAEPHPYSVLGLGL